MRKGILLSAAVILYGGCGAFIRSNELQNAYDLNGLHISGYTLTYVLIGLSILFVLLAAVFSRLALKPRENSSYEAVFSGHFPVDLLAGFCLVASAVIGMYVQINSELVVMQFILQMLAFISGVCIIAISVRCKSGKIEASTGILALLPVFFTCLWMILTYRDWGRDPVLLDYVYGLLALVFATVGIFHAAGFKFKEPRYRLTMFFNLVGAYFSIITLADTHTLSVFLAYLFCALYCLHLASASFAGEKVSKI